MSISSHSSLPTSPMWRQPVAASIVKLNGFRRPGASTRRAALSASATNGLSGGVSAADRRGRGKARDVEVEDLDLELRDVERAAWRIVVADARGEHPVRTEGEHLAVVLG